MSTVSPLAQATYATAADAWLQNVAGNDACADARATIHSPSRLHVPAAPVMAATQSNPANDNQDWEGGFDGHLGVYRRD